MKKEFKVTTDNISPCPKCGNKHDFIAHSKQVAEDCCEVWVSCKKCGLDPTEVDTDYRIEDVWGSLDPDSIRYALMYSWNEPIENSKLAPHHLTS